MEPHLLSARIGILEARYRRPKVGDFGSDVGNLICPEIFLSCPVIPGHVHINAPGIRIPRNLPIEMQAAKQFHTDIDPKACRTYATGRCTPPTLFDESTSSRYVIHPLQGSLGHDLIYVQNDGGSGTDDGVSVRILKRFQ